MTAEIMAEDWTPFSPYAGTAGFARRDGYRLTFMVDVDDRRIVVAHYLSREVGRAEIRVRERDQQTILVPVSTDPRDVAEALRFWTSRPSVHVAALGFADDVEWPALRATRPAPEL